MKKAVIMAGGFGTRLRPITSNLPKPMVPMLNVPMMEHIVNLLKRHNITDVLSLLYYQPEKITGYFGNGAAFDVNMEYKLAQADYGTAGAVRYAADKLDERFIIISGDVLTDFNLEEALAFHQSKKAQATIVLTKAQVPLQFGIVMTDDEGRITRFLEKPSWGEVFTDTINTGIYILEPEVLDLIPYQKEFDFSKDLFPMMLEKNLALYGYVAEGYWADVGNLNQYQEAHDDALAGRVQVQHKGRKQGGAYIAESADVDDSAQLNGNILIGENSKIGAGAQITDSVIGDGVTIGAGARIVNSIIWNRVHIGVQAELTADVVCDDTRIGDHVTIAENVFIADACEIGDYAALHSNIKLWPNKQVEPYAIVTRSMVQEEKWLRELFSNARVTGLSNIEMIPEFGAKFGAALGNSLGAGATVVAGRDANPASRMVKRAITTGLMSVGVNVTDVQDLPLPLTRQRMMDGSAVGGIHVRRSPHLPKHIDIILMNSEGRDFKTAQTKKIERLFFGEDIKRVASDKIGIIHYPERTYVSYLERFRSNLNVAAIKQRNFSIAVDYSYGMSAAIFPRILGELNCSAIGLNAYVDPERSTRTQEDTERAQAELSTLMESLHLELGVIIEPAVEKIALVDSSGRWYSSQRLVSIVTKLFLLTHADREPYKIAVPVSATGEIDMMAAEHDVEVLRVKNSHSAMMEATLTDGVLYVGGTRAGFIFADFFFAADAMFTAGKILEMLALSGKTLAEVDDMIPVRAQSRREIPCPWESKGTVMREAMEYSEGKDRQLIDGVKVFDGERSVLLLPDREKAIFHVIAEADSQTLADEFADHYAGRVAGWRDQ